jgi:predicted ATPase
MKIKFWNLGSIKEAELDLRPLTVIIGPNNSNKTYIAYSIYGLWRELRHSFFVKTGEYVLEISYDKEKGIWALKIDESFYGLVFENIQYITEEVFKGRNLDLFFQDSSHKIFAKTHFQIKIDNTQIQTAVQQLSVKDFVDFVDNISKIEFKKNRLFVYLDLKKDGSHLVKYRNDSGAVENDFDQHMIITTILLITKKIFSYTIPLPAERNAFINTYKMLEKRRFNLLKDRDRALLSDRRSIQRQLVLSQEQGDIRYPQPVEDFLDFLSDIELENNPDPDPDNKNEFQKLADQIEEHIQNKNKTKFKKTKFGGREIKIAVKRGLEIDLYNASSSIKQLAPLLLYLRYRAKSGDFLVIDEPEMNLHPESQVKLLEALAILVNLGVRVLLTTHSPYLMSHLNNIVNGNHQDQDILEAQAQSLYLQDSQAFLKMEQVSAYEMKNNKLISLHDPDYGIRWDTLSDVSVDVQQKFFAIYEAGQKSKDTEA